MERRRFLQSVGITGLGSAALATSSGVNRVRALDEHEDSYEPLGSVDVSGAAEAVVGDDEDTVYLATIDGFATVDISDPTAPEILADRRNLLEGDERELTGILDVKVSGDRLVVPGPANPADDDQFRGFLLYDVSDPADPVAVTEPYETETHIHNCFLEDELLYIVTNDFETNPLVIFDVSDDDPEEIGWWSIVDFEPGWEDVEGQLFYLHDVYVHDDIAYLAYWNAGTYLLDVSNPSDPEYLSHVAETTLEEQREIASFEVGDYQLGLPGNDHYSAVDETGEILAVGREAWETDAPEADRPGGIDLYDVTDPTEPVYAATIDAPESPDATYRGGQWTTAHNFEIRDGWLYSSWYQGGVKIHDLSALEEPEEIAAWRDPSVAGFWTARVAQPGETFVASSTPLIPRAGTEGALYVFPSGPGEQADPPSFDEPDEPGSEDDSDDAGGTEDDGATNDTDETADTGGTTDDGTGSDAEDESNGSREDGNGTATDVDNDTAEAIPGFAVAGGVAGGAITLEWLRRRSGLTDDDAQE